MRRSEELIIRGQSREPQGGRVNEKTHSCSMLRRARKEPTDGYSAHIRLAPMCRSAHHRIWCMGREPKETTRGFADCRNIHRMSVCLNALGCVGVGGGVRLGTMMEGCQVEIMRTHPARSLSTPHPSLPSSRFKASLQRVWWTVVIFDLDPHCQGEQ
ncbi:hypothetical protein K437DRAFT_115339 [Tilletiaria anomala UBC 951]|uniref:Uncharacterized protein n=1 Tax=Tilletiaria anomala (strain ATCC 24038 / CBS 436.72 / UBC 951) TaxID=1037660 RepID=A0A066WGF1_TILAU|nr:uncharacterized protein K437DRAFT_115339 [Tilletiaria anomala UBC 951]KDN53067.1 hypothetical protein K437DRAFT_115339 [Tilletiaria anomala UBC 951]